MSPFETVANLPLSQDESLIVLRCLQQADADGVYQGEFGQMVETLIERLTDERKRAFSPLPERARE